MHKSDYLQQKNLNPADELRSILTSLEQRQVSVKTMNSTQTLILLRDLDQAYALSDQLETSGMSFLPEQGRFRAVQARLKKDVSHLLKALGGPVALGEYRPTPAPTRERWWWYIHELVAAKQRRLLRRAVIGFVVTLLILAGIILAFNTILAPSPEAIARVDAENDANAAAEQGDYRSALSAIETGLEKVSSDPGLLIYKGVLHQVLEEQDQADLAFAQAQAQIEEQPHDFYVARSQIWLRVDRPDLAEQDTRLVLSQNENVARAWLILGQSLQLQGRDFEAIPAYERAGQVALENGDDEIVVLARLALGQISASPR